MRFKLQRAKAVGNSLNRVLDRVGKVVHRVNAPAVACAVVLKAVNAVNYRIAHIKVARGEVDFCAERHASVLKLALAHTLKQIKAFLNRSVAVGAFCRSLGVAAVLAHLLGVELAYIGKAFFD